MSTTPPGGSAPNDPRSNGFQPSYGQSGPGPEWNATHHPNWQPPQPLRPEDQRLWSTLTHVGGILFSFVAPLVAYLVLRDRGAFIREHTRVALNFNLTMLIAYLIGGATSIIGIGFLINLAAFVVTIVFAVQAAVAANQGRFFTYPLSIEFIRR